MISDYQGLPAAIASLVATTETAIVENVLDAGAGGQFPQGKVIRGYISFTTGATGGLMTLRVRQGLGTGGAAVGAPATTVVATTAATTQYVMPYCFQDPTPGIGAYTLTATVTGSNASIQDANCEIIMPDPYGTE